MLLTCRIGIVSQRILLIAHHEIEATDYALLLVQMRLGVVLPPRRMSSVRLSGVPTLSLSERRSLRLKRRRYNTDHHQSHEFKRRL